MTTIKDKPVSDLIRMIELAEEALIKIASFNEGDEVTSAFDCPHHAKLARETLSEIRKLKGE